MRSFIYNTGRGWRVLSISYTAHGKELSEWSPTHWRRGTCFTPTPHVQRMQTENYSLLFMMSQCTQRKSYRSLFCSLLVSAPLPPYWLSWPINTPNPWGSLLKQSSLGCTCPSATFWKNWKPSCPQISSINCPASNHHGNIPILGVLSCFDGVVKKNYVNFFFFELDSLYI